MPSVEDNYQLLLAIIRQMAEINSIVGIDWQRVADDFNLAKASAANMRWSRFRHANGLNHARTGGNDPEITGTGLEKKKQNNKRNKAKTPKTELKEADDGVKMEGSVEHQDSAKSGNKKPIKKETRDEDENLEGSDSWGNRVKEYDSYQEDEEADGEEA